MGITREGSLRRSLALVFAVGALLLPGSGLAQQDGTGERRAGPKFLNSQRERYYQLMSAMGARMAGLAPAPIREDSSDGLIPANVLSALTSHAPYVIGSSDITVHPIPANATQAETTIAVNNSGTVLVAGWNEARGFSLNQATTGISLSGVGRSTDGGLTWTTPFLYQGLPVLPSIRGEAVYGDPDVKYDALNNRWVYASLYLRSDNASGIVIHTSTDDGSTWLGPYQLTQSFSTVNFADKEFMDINQATGRILVTWTNFPNAGAPSIRSEYSDDGGQNWSALSTVSNLSVDASGSCPRFRSTNNNAFVVWARTYFNPPQQTYADLKRTIAFSKSTDGGATWAAATEITPQFPYEDYCLGVDRLSSFPSLAVDNTGGNIYVVYQRNTSVGEGDIAFQRSTDGGSTFSSFVYLDSNPGNDRAQTYPWVAVDQTNGRVHVVFYDQEAGGSAGGDLQEVMHTSSTDGGVTWTRPTPMTDRPFHAGYGNDTGQPNMGDYIQVVARNGKAHAAFAGTSVAPRYDEGQPTSGSLDTPDAYYDQTADSQNVASLRLGTVTFAEACSAGTNGNLDPGETADFTFPLRNYVTNPVTSPITFTGVSATLTSPTAGVTITQGTQSYANIGPGATSSNASPFKVALSSGFTPGTYVDFVLSVTTGNGGSTQQLYRLPTGSAGTTTTLLSENFDGSSSLPVNWSSVHGAGTTTVPWTISSTFTGLTSNGAFHSEATGYKWERLFSPPVNVPSTSSNSYLTLDFDITYNLEVENSQAIQAYDGLFLRVRDETTGATLRSVLAEAFAETIKTGTQSHYPRHLPRDQTTGYFEDMSCWSGNSNGMKHVSMKFPGLGMVGRTIKLVWEYTEDGSGVCATPPCGVAIDNVVFKHIVSATSTCTPGTGGGPTISTVVPSSGFTTGGTSVTITGTGFQTGATVTFGGTAATNVNVSGTTSITCTTPAHAAGTVDVQVTNPGTGGSALKTSAFTFNPPSSGCTTSGPDLCIQANRFSIHVNWTNRYVTPAVSGVGTAVGLTGDTGYFWFFNSSNVELIIKVLDGRAVNGKFWVFYGALTDVEYTIFITDTQTAATHNYFSPNGNLKSIADINAF